MVLTLSCWCTNSAVRYRIHLWCKRIVEKKGLEKEACEVMQLTGWLPEDVMALVQSLVCCLVHA